MVGYRARKSGCKRTTLTSHTIDKINDSLAVTGAHNRTDFSKPEHARLTT